jgi:hypothetical protein
MTGGGEVRRNPVDGPWMGSASAVEEVIGIDAGADHAAAARHLLDHGWTPCGRGEFAIGLRSPSGLLVARISPFDPTARFTADLYRSGEATGWFPHLALERELEGGANLLLNSSRRSIARR